MHAGRWLLSLLHQAALCLGLSDVRAEACRYCPCCCCCSVLKYQDWVWSVVARGGLLLVASGPEVHVHDLPTGKLVRKVSKAVALQQRR
jgi:hypothetical protein